MSFCCLLEEVYLNLSRMSMFIHKSIFHIQSPKFFSNTFCLQRASRGKVDMSVLNVPDGGVSRSVRQSMAMEPQQQRPVPGGGRPRPKPRAVKSLPKVRALYDYEAADVDEISIKEGDEFELIQERE